MLTSFRSRAAVLTILPAAQTLMQYLPRNLAEGRSSKQLHGGVQREVLVASLRYLHYVPALPHSQTVVILLLIHTSPCTHSLWQHVSGKYRFEASPSHAQGLLNGALVCCHPCQHLQSLLKVCLHACLLSSNLSKLLTRRGGRSSS